MSTHTAAHCSTLRGCIHRRRLQKSSKHTADIIISSFFFILQAGEWNRACRPGDRNWYPTVSQVSATHMKMGTRRWNLRVPDLQMSSTDLPWVIGYQVSISSNGYQTAFPSARRHIHNLLSFINMNIYWIYCHRHTPLYGLYDIHPTPTPTTLQISPVPRPSFIPEVIARRQSMWPLWMLRSYKQISQNKTKQSETSMTCHQKS